MFFSSYRDYMAYYFNSQVEPCHENFQMRNAKLWKIFRCIDSRHRLIIVVLVTTQSTIIDLCKCLVPWKIDLRSIDINLKKRRETRNLNSCHKLYDSNLLKVSTFTTMSVFYVDHYISTIITVYCVRSEHEIDRKGPTRRSGLSNAAVCIIVPFRRYNYAGTHQKAAPVRHVEFLNY